MKDYKPSIRATLRYDTQELLERALELDREKNRPSDHSIEEMNIDNRIYRILKMYIQEMKK